MIANIPLMRNTLKLSLVLDVRLHAQADREHELAHRRGETGQESVERLRREKKPPRSVTVQCTPALSHFSMKVTHKVARDHAVDELQDADGDEEGEEGVEQLDALRRLVDVFLPHALADLLQVLLVAQVAGGFVGGFGRLAAGGGDGAGGFGCAGRNGGGGGRGGDVLFGSHGCEWYGVLTIWEGW